MSFWGNGSNIYIKFKNIIYEVCQHRIWALLSKKAATSGPIVIPENLHFYKASK